MLVTFCVWNVVISLSMVELKSVMCNSNQGNRGVRNWEWSGMEWNGVEQSGIRIIRIKIKEKCNIIACICFYRCLVECRSVIIECTTSLLLSCIYSRI